MHQAVVFFNLADDLAAFCCTHFMYNSVDDVDGYVHDALKFPGSEHGVDKR